MITVRRASERGRTRIDWLDSWHSFSFGDYHDDEHMGFRGLRVINDDVIAPGQGFGTHGHRDMEIVTWMLDGALAHRDSLGSGDVLRPGDVQRMTAGRGIQHSEFNGSETEPAHLIQIWIQPDQRGAKPTYEQVHVPRAERENRWRRIADGEGRDGALTIGADASVLTALVSKGRAVSHELAKGRHAWLHVAKGRVRAHGRELAAGDALALSSEPRVEVEALEDAELLLFDLA